MTSIEESNSPVNDGDSCPFVFIDSSDPENPHQIIRTGDTKPIFKPPFPPILEPKYFISKKEAQGRIPSRSPNAFMIYRRVYAKAAREDGCQLPMTVMSIMASKAWNQEQAHVKTEYKRLANMARIEFETKYQKKTSPRVSKRWRVATSRSSQVMRNKFTDNSASPRTSSFVSAPDKLSPASQIDNLNLETFWEKQPAKNTFDLCPQKEPTSSHDVESLKSAVSLDELYTTYFFDVSQPSVQISADCSQIAMPTEFYLNNISEATSSFPPENSH